MKYFKTMKACSNQKSKKETQIVSSVFQPTFDTYGNPIMFSMTMNESFDSSDLTLLWSVMKPTPIVNRGQRNPGIVFRKSTLYLQEWQTTDQLPRCVYINIDGINGTLDKNGNSTTRVARFELKDEVVLQQTPLTYTAVYQLKQDTVIELPVSLTTLNFRVSFDDDTTAVQLPLSRPFPLRVDFIRFVNSTWKNSLKQSEDVEIINQQI